MTKEMPDDEGITGHFEGNLQVPEEDFFSLVDSLSYSLHILGDDPTDLLKGLAVHQPEKKHLAVFFVMYILLYQFLNLTVAVFHPLPPLSENGHSKAG